MDAEDLTKTVDNIYKNILEKFNPGARQLITAGKSYLKALHGAASATRLFNEALAKIALNAQQSEINDIGTALLGIVGVYKEIQEQQMNILKAFYVDLLVPLETNLDKDTKVVQYEQKKFMQQHKMRMDNYQKAVSTMKKQRKKKTSSENTEKEIRNLQILQEQKKKLNAFCEQSFKNAITQERRRYGFVLERQCSIAKHLMTYHTTGRLIIENNLENWQDVAASREIIPANAFEPNSEFGLNVMEHINGDNISQLKKSCSVDAPYGDIHTLHKTNDNYMQNSLSRAKSDFNIAVKRSSNDITNHGNWDQRAVVRALYAYMPSGENQLPFEEGDRIALVGGKANGWQFGENLRLKIFGWFPIAYTNAAEHNVYASGFRNDIDSGDGKKNSDLETLDSKNSAHGERYENMHYNRREFMSDHNEQMLNDLANERSLNDNDIVGYPAQFDNEDTSLPSMFSDTMHIRNKTKNDMYRTSPNKNPRPGPPPTLPAPVPSVQNRFLNLSRSFCTPNGPPVSLIDKRRKKTQNGVKNVNNSPHMLTKHQMVESNQPKSSETTKTSLHSSNDSGFANEPPPQPAVDYSDDEQNNRVPIRYHDKMREKVQHEVASLTLNRSYRNSIGSENGVKQLLGKNDKIPYGLIASDDEILLGNTGGTIRRTKSFWKFRGKRNTDDILAGMSLWQHRDLVVARNLEQLPKNTNTLSKQQQEKSKSIKQQQNNNKKSFNGLESYAGEDDIYNMSRDQKDDLSTIKTLMKLEMEEKNTDISTLRPNQSNLSVANEYKRQSTIKSQHNHNNNEKLISKKAQNQQQYNHAQRIYANTEADDFESNSTLKMNNNVKNYFDEMSTNNKGRDGDLLVKTVKRKDILKQYYTSDDEDDDDFDKMEATEDEELEMDEHDADEQKDVDVETVKSDSFDPYDCIVINDHLVHKDEAHQRHIRTKSYKEQEIKFQTFRTTMTKTQHDLSLEKQTNPNERNKLTAHEEFGMASDLSLRYMQPAAPPRRTQSEHVDLNSPSATILPRTRLIKSSHITTKTDNINLNDENESHKQYKLNYAKTYGPWFDFWDLQKKEQYFNQSLNRQQTAKRAGKN